MKQIQKLAACFLLSGIIASCKKELSCENCATGSSNKPPLACAGPDQSVTLPSNTVTLDGSCSIDPENNITSYQWIKINGPASSDFVNASGAKTDVNNLTEGDYFFELKVTDAGGLMSKDTVQVMVNPAASTYTCSDSNRPAFNAQLVLIGKLSKTRIDLAVAAAGSKVVFAGGVWTTDCPDCWGSAQVDIYDTVSKIWTTAKLSAGRWGITAITAGNKIFFAGGEFGDGANDTYYTNIDIYDASAQSWSLEHMSEARSQVGAALVGNKLFFAGGEKNWNYDCSDRVDIYDLSAKRWSTATLSRPRAFLSAVAADDKIYFAGGTTENRWYATSNMIDIYDNRTGTWSTSSLKVHDGIVGGAILNDNIYWSRGCPVEIRNATTGTSKMASLSRPAGTRYPVVKNGKIVFVQGGDRFDVYDPANDKWSVGRLPLSIELMGNVVSVNNTIYLTDGDGVYKLEF